MSALLVALLAVLATVCLVSVGYLLTVLTAALGRDRASERRDGAPPRITVIIPAHDEELVLAQTLESLRAQNYPENRLEIVVVADNCTDATTRIAREGGAIVLERDCPELRGKGFALAWAFDLLLGTSSPCANGPADAFVILDADTWADPESIAHLADALPTEPGALAAIQGRYGVLNPGFGWRAALMAAAFELCNHVKLLGLDRLGLSVGLKGNGMIFTRATLEQVPWTGRSITEDIDYGLDLLSNHGVRVAYAPQARVLAQMPVTAAQGESQRARWEGGRYRLMRSRVPKLLAAAVRRRDARLLVAALDLIVPPLAELVGILALWAGAWALGGGLLAPATRLGFALAWGVVALGFVVYVLAGLQRAGASPEAYRALLRAPFYVIWKLVLYLRRSRSAPLPGASDEWVRTERIERSAEEKLQSRRAKGTQ